MYVICRSFTRLGLSPPFSLLTPLAPHLPAPHYPQHIPFVSHFLPPLAFHLFNFHSSSSLLLPPPPLSHSFSPISSLPLTPSLFHPLSLPSFILSLFPSSHPPSSHHSFIPYPSPPSPCHSSHSLTPSPHHSFIPYPSLHHFYPPSPYSPPPTITLSSPTPHPLTSLHFLRIQEKKGTQIQEWRRTVQ